MSKIYISAAHIHGGDSGRGGSEEVWCKSNAELGRIGMAAKVCLEYGEGLKTTTKGNRG